MNSTTIDDTANNGKIDIGLGLGILVALVTFTIALVKKITNSFIPAIFAVVPGSISFLLSILISNKNPSRNDLVTAIAGYTILATLGVTVHEIGKIGLRRVEPIQPIIFDTNNDLESESEANIAPRTPSLQFTATVAPSNVGQIDAAGTATAAHNNKVSQRNAMA